MSRAWLNSADSHVNEPGDLWEKPLGAKWGDAVPRVIEPVAGGDGSIGGGGRVYFTGEDYLPTGDLDLGDEMVQRARRTNVDPVYRAACMDEDGVWAELLFPTKGMMVFPLPNTDLARDCFAVYNDWLHEYCSQVPARMLGAALIHMEDVDLALAELERNAKRGFRCGMINGDTRPEWGCYSDPKYDRFWAATTEMGIPVAIHISTGMKKDVFVFTGDKLRHAPRGYLDLMAEAGQVVANEFIFGGIFDRFPELDLFLVEYEASWVPHWLYRCEQVAYDFGPNLGVVPPRRPVREYLDQLYVGVIDDPLIRTVTSELDPNRLMWGSDYPHVRNTHLKSHRIVEEAFGHLDAAVIDNIAFNNAARLFNIDMPAQALAGAPSP